MHMIFSHATKWLKIYRITTMPSTYLRNEFDFWNVNDSMNIPKIKFISYIYILL